MKRTGDTEEQYETRAAETSAYAETIRNIHESSNTPKPKADGEEKISVFWRVFGGTLLSISALVAITVFNNVSGSIAELRGEVTRLNEAKADSAKKDDVSTLRAQMAIHAGYRGEIDSLKERASKYRAEIEECKKDTQARLEAAKKERETVLEGMKKDLAAVETLKEKSAAVAAELKLAKDDILHIRQDVDKNQAADHERRDQRTAQMKLIDETLKDIQKNLLESREKIARLEGQQSPTKTIQAGGTEK